MGLFSASKSTEPQREAMHRAAVERQERMRNGLIELVQRDDQTNFSWETAWLQWGEGYKKILLVASEQGIHMIEERGERFEPIVLFSYSRIVALEVRENEVAAVLSMIPFTGSKPRDEIGSADDEFSFFTVEMAKTDVGKVILERVLSHYAEQGGDQLAQKLGMTVTIPGFD